MDLAQMCLQGSVLIVIVLIVRALFGQRMPKAVLPVLWGLVLVRLLIPFSITTPWSAWSAAGQSLAYSGAAGAVAVADALDGVGALPVVAEPVSSKASSGATESGYAAESVEAAGGGLIEAGASTPFTTAGTAWDTRAQQVQTAGTAITTEEASQASVPTQMQAASEADGMQPGTTSTEVGSVAGEEASSASLPDAPARLIASIDALAASVGTWVAGLAAWQIAWGVGALVSFTVIDIIYLRFVREFRLAVPVDDPFAQVWLQAHPLHRTVRIKACGLVHSPMTYGLLRPTILVPVDLDWSDRVHVGLMLEHELVHIRRFDIAFKAALVVAVCLYWFNPLVWALYVLANHDLELSCDERVLRRLDSHGRAAYANALIDAAENGTGLLPAAAGFGKSALSRRILAIVQPGRPRAIATVAAGALIVAATTAFATTGIVSADTAGALGLGQSGPTAPDGLPDIQQIRVTGGDPGKSAGADGSKAPDGGETSDSDAFVPAALGSLPWPGEDAREIDLDGYRVIATHGYAVTLPDNIIGDGFSWDYDDQATHTTEHETEAQGAVQATASKILSVDGALDVQGRPVSFKVFCLMSDEYKTWTGACPLGPEYVAQEIRTTSLYVATNDGLTPEEHGLLGLVSADRQNGWAGLVSPAPNSSGADETSDAKTATESSGASSGAGAPPGRTVAITSELWRIETPRYTFNVPEYWRGRVEASFAADGTLSIYPNGHPELGLMRVTVYGPNEGPISGGDIAGGTLYGIDDGYGNTVTAYAINYVWLSLGPSWRDGRGGLAFPGDGAAREVVDLSTGGAFSFDELEATDPQGFNGSSGFSYCREVLATNLQVAMEPTWAAAMSLAFEGHEDMSIAQFQQRALEMLGGDRELLGRVVALADNDELVGAAWPSYPSEQATFIRDVVAPLLRPLLDAAANAPVASGGTGVPVACEFSGRAGVDPIGYLTYTLSTHVDDPTAVSVTGFRSATSWLASQLDRLPSSTIVNDMAMSPDTARRALEIAIGNLLAESEADGMTLDISWDYEPGTMAVQG